jgi:hypothetical protein
MLEVLPQLIIKINMTLDYKDYNKELIDEKKLNNESILYNFYEDLNKKSIFYNSEFNDAFDELTLLHFVIMRTVHVYYFENKYDTMDLTKFEQSNFEHVDNYYRSLEIFPIVQGIGFLLSSLPTMDLTGNIQEPYILSGDYIQNSCKDYYLAKNLVENFGLSHYGLGSISSIFMGFDNLAIEIIKEAKGNMESPKTYPRTSADKSLPLFMDLLFDTMITNTSTKYSISPLLVDYITTSWEVFPMQGSYLESLMWDLQYNRNSILNLNFIELVSRISLYLVDSSTTKLLLSSLLSSTSSSSKRPSLQDKHPLSNIYYQNSNKDDYEKWMVLKFFFQEQSVFFSTSESIDNMNKNRSFLSKLTEEYNIYLNNENIEMAKLMLKNIIEKEFITPLSSNRNLDFSFLKREDLLVSRDELSPPKYFKSDNVSKIDTYGVNFHFKFKNEVYKPTQVELSMKDYWIRFIKISLTKILFYVYYVRLCDKLYYTNDIPNYYINLNTTHNSNYNIMRKSILKSRAKPESQLRGLCPRFSKKIPNLGLYKKKSRENGGKKRQRTTEKINYCKTCGSNKPAFYSFEKEALCTKKKYFCNNICRRYYYYKIFQTINNNNNNKF